MNADDLKVEAVLKEDRRFIVPIYQRKYQWGENRLLPFWDDVQAKAAEVLRGESKFDHYMGALILAPVDIGSQISRTPVLQVVDGQQRLTTFQLLLVALREVARTHGLPELMKHAEGYIYNNVKAKDTDPLTRYKLTPTPSDCDLYTSILDETYPEVVARNRHLFWGTSVPKNTPFPAFRAYVLFVNWIEKFAAEGAPDEADVTDDEARLDSQSGEGADQPVAERLEALLNALLEHLKLVVITLGERDDAQVIFETLNSMGEPLLAMDLVRNNIFHRAEQQKSDVKSLYHKLWDPLDHSWWREAAPNARPARQRIDHFLANTLAAETGDPVSMRELYAEYRSYALPNGKPRYGNVEDELKILERHAPAYEILEGRRASDADLFWFGRKMAAWQVTTVYPVAMQLAAQCSDLSERRLALRLLYSYIVRRALCDLTTKNFNNVFYSLAKAFVREGASLSSLTEFFAHRSGDSARFPDDAELRAGILNNNAYRIQPQPRLVDILWELETASRTSLTEKAEKPTGLWVEHILPRTWTIDWPYEGADFAAPYSGVPQADARHAALNTLGNLTLLTSGLNISAGNLSFRDKLAKFEEHTGLFLNRYFQGRPGWQESDIRERGEHLARLAVGIWPSPGGE